MFYHDSKLQYRVRVDKPNPLFAKMLQQAIGGIEGEMRVCLQYLFQAWGCRGPVKYRDMLLETGTEEIAHIEMLATAVALNLEGAPVEMQEEAAKNPVIEAVLGGTMPRHILSTGLAALPVDSNGVPFTGAYIAASGNIAADMYSNVMAESTGRLLATRLHQITDDPGMKDMLSFLIARDSMHQNQWLAVLEELGEPLPVPNTFPRTMENQQFSYAFMSTNIEKKPAPDARWVKGPSIDRQGEFSYIHQSELPGDEPTLAPPDPRLFGANRMDGDGRENMAMFKKQKQTTDGSL